MARFLSGFEEIIVPTYHRFVPPVPYSTSMRFPTYSSSNSSFVVIGEEGGSGVDVFFFGVVVVVLFFFFGGRPGPFFFFGGIVDRVEYLYEELENPI